VAVGSGTCDLRLQRRPRLRRSERDHHHRDHIQLQQWWRRGYRSVPPERFLRLQWCNGCSGQSVTITAAGSNCQYGGVELQVGSGTPSYVCNGAPGTNGPCAVDTAPIINAFTMSAGLPYTATVNVAYGGTGTLDFYFDGDAGTFTQTTFTNPYAFNFVPDESGGPYNFNATVTDGCLLAMKSLTGIYTPPADVAA